MAWQPIETAPKNRTSRHVWVPDYRCIYCVVWREADEDKREGWSIFGGGWRDMIQGATHWMPLPEPPPADRPTPQGEDNG